MVLNQVIKIVKPFHLPQRVRCIRHYHNAQTNTVQYSNHFIFIVITEVYRLQRFFFLD